jgi:hypothetical protein
MQNGQRCHLIWDRESSLFEVSDERLFIFQNHDQQRPLSAMKLITWLWQCIFFVAKTIMSENNCTRI